MMKPTKWNIAIDLTDIRLGIACLLPLFTLDARLALLFKQQKVRP